MINFVIDYDKSKHPRLMGIKRLSECFKSEEDVLKSSSLCCWTVNFWFIKTYFQNTKPLASAAL